MTAQMEKLLEAEIAFVRNWVEYPNEDLEPMTTLDEARTQIEGILTDYDGNDFPLNLSDPEIMLMVWNHVAAELDEARKIIEADAWMASEHPDWLRFPKRYDTGESAFFDLENLVADIHVYLHYDEQHCNVVREAMKAFAKEENK